MAAIIWNVGEQSVIDAWLSGRGSGADYSGTAAGASGVTIPKGTATVSSFGLGMGAQTGGVGSNKTFVNGSNVSTTIAEIGQTTAAGYARQGLTRDTTGWPAATLVTTSYQSTAPQQTFTFTGAPSLNGATLWFVAGSTVLGAANCLFGADTAAIRTFANGDTERITPTYRQT